MEGMRPVDPGAGPESTAPRAPMARPTRSAASPASESRYSTDPGWPDSDGSTARPRALCDRARARVPVGGQTYRFRALTRSGPVLSESELSDFAGELGRLGFIGAFKTRLEYVTMISARPRTRISSCLFVRISSYLILRISRIVMMISDVQVRQTGDHCRWTR